MFPRCLGPQNVFWVLSATPKGSISLHSLFLSKCAIPFCLSPSQELPASCEPQKYVPEHQARKSLFPSEEQEHDRACVGQILQGGHLLSTSCMPELCQVPVYEVSKSPASLCLGSGWGSKEKFLAVSSLPLHQHFAPWDSRRSSSQVYPYPHKHALDHVALQSPVPRRSYHPLYTLPPALRTDPEHSVIPTHSTASHSTKG